MTSVQTPDVPADAVESPSLYDLPALPLEQASTTTNGKATYTDILKSSALVGGSSVLNVVIGIARTKVMALLLGPAGFGLFGLYTSIATLTGTLAGMGINSSGVREIAEAVGSNDQRRIAETAITLRRISALLGLIGASLLLVFAQPISKVTFGGALQANSIRLLSLAVLFQLVSGGQSALIQGMRRIPDLVKMNVIGASSALILSIPIIYFFRAKGIVPSLICMAAVTIGSSWWYSRKIRIEPAPLTSLKMVEKAGSFLKLGFAFMTSGLLVAGVSYTVRVVLLHKVGVAATGIYQSAWTLGGLYVGIILQAMGSDFYPRLSAVHHDNKECNRLVNEQTLVGILLAGPGVIATLTFAPLVISLFYSSKFAPAVGVLRWVCLGAALQVVTWPIGFITIAKARQDFFLISECLWALSAIAVAWFCIVFRGLNGAGFAFFLAYVIHAAIVYPIAKHLSGFRWSIDNRRTGLVFSILIATAFGGFYLLPFSAAVAAGSLAAVFSVLFSIRSLIKLVPPADMPRPLRTVLTRFSLLPAQ
jgi:antigen flippase